MAASDAGTPPHDQPTGPPPGSHPFAGDPVFDLHVGGKMEVRSTVGLGSRDDLSLAYTPGVARVCEAIAADPSLTQHYTWVPNTVAVVTDGTAVLGLGDIGPAAAMPVMEGKAVLFKQFGGVDALPICLATTDVEEIIETVARLAPSFGGINLEDISAPRCFEIEDRLKAMLDIPVFHDDQHGTAVVALAALTNALALTGRTPETTRVVVSGAGAAGVAVARILLNAGVSDIAVVDRQGVVNSRRADLTPVKKALAALTADRHDRSGALADVMVGADVYIGVSGGTVAEEVVASMADEAIVFGLANPIPEVPVEIAHIRPARDLIGNPDVVVRDVELVASGWHVLRRTTFDYRPRTADGRTEQRETYDRGDGATILLYDADPADRAAHPPVPLPGVRERPPRRHARRDCRRAARRRRPGDGDPARGGRGARGRGRRVGARVRRLDEPGVGDRAAALLRRAVHAASRTAEGGGLADDGEDIEVLELRLRRGARGDRQRSGGGRQDDHAAAVGRPERSLPPVSGSAATALVCTRCSPSAGAPPRSTRRTT